MIIAQKFVDLKHQEEPVQLSNLGIQDLHLWRKSIKLEQNEAILEDASIGFLEAGAEPINFLSVNSINDLPLTDHPYQIEISLTNEKNFYQRKAYTFLTLLGDFGGFNDAIIFLINAFMGIYSAKMYLAQISSELASDANSTEY